MWFDGSVTGGHTDILQAFIDAATSSSMGTDAWEVLEDDSASVPNERHVFMVAPGNASGDEIYVNFRTYYNVGSDYYNISFRYAEAYSASFDYDNQIGSSTEQYILLNDNNMDYWFAINGQRAIIVCSVSGVYECAYVGWILRNGNPSDYPYPVVALGPCDVEATRWSSTTSTTHGSFFYPTQSNGALRDLNGQELTVGSTVKTFPYFFSTGGTIPDNSDIKKGPGGGVLPLEIALYADTNENIYGTFDGAYWVSGFGLTAEDRFWDGSIQYIAFPSAYQSAFKYWVLIRME